MKNLTRAERLEQYKKALAFMSGRRYAMKGHGVCYALSLGDIVDSFYPNGKVGIKTMYPEMWKNRPHRRLSTFWWDQYNDRGYHARMYLKIGRAHV